MASKVNQENAGDHLRIPVEIDYAPA